MHLLPAADIPGNRNGYEGKPDQHDQQHFPYRYGMDQRPHMRVAKIKAGCADKHPHDDHGLQPLQAAFKKTAYGELAPSVIVSVTDHKPRQNKEEVDSQVTV